MTPKPLSGISVIITRPEKRSGSTIQVFRNAGADVHTAPVLRFAPIQGQPDSRFMKHLRMIGQKGGWLILPSPTAIDFFFGSILPIHPCPDDLNDIRFAVIGQTSAELLRGYGQEAEFTAPGSNARSLAKSLPNNHPSPVMIAGSGQSRRELPEGLAARGFDVELIHVYEPVEDPKGLAELISLTWKLEYATILISSPSAVEIIISGLATQIISPHRMKWLALGDTTAGRLKDLVPDIRHLATSAGPSPVDLVDAALQLAEISAS